MRLQPVPGMLTRPTADRVREALFNILSPWIADARVLDLFAGTGALGIEALSRGAREAVFVERDPKAVRVLRANLRHTGLEPLARVYVGDALREAARLGGQGMRFDLILVDPPYRTGLAQAALAALDAAGAVAPGAWVVVEHAAQEDMPERAANLTKVRAARYGDTVLAFYRPSPGVDEPGAGPAPPLVRGDGPQASGHEEGC